MTRPHEEHVSDPLMRPSNLSLLAVLAALCLGGCDSPPPDLREWTPADHHGETQNPERTRQSTGEPASTEPGLDEVTLATWSKACTLCHGRIGRGDGPQAPMTQPRDLTDPAWQASVSDEQIEKSIREGKGKMPAFPLPDGTIKSLVQLIRRLAAVAPAAPDQAASDTTAGDTAAAGSGGQPAAAQGGAPAAAPGATPTSAGNGGQP